MDNKKDRHSTMGYAFFCAGSLVSWSSKKQQTIVLSTMEAEYLAGTEASKEAIWIQQFLQAIGIQSANIYPVKLYGDNQSANALAKNPEYHSKTKHIHRRQRFITKLVEQGTITVSCIPIRNMVADTLTKALPKDQHWYFMRMLGLQTTKMKSEIIGVMVQSGHTCRQCGEEYKSHNKLYTHLREIKHEKD